MQIKDLFELDPALSILAGHKGLERVIETVSVMDAPDIYRWMKGGELLLTSGYVMHQSESSLVDLILLLHEADVAGLAIKVERYLNTIPQEALDLSEELGFPIIFIPGTYAFSDMISMILKEILSEKNRKLRLSRNIHNRFTDIVIKGYGIQEIVDVLSQLIEKKVEYYDEFFDRIFISSSIGKEIPGELQQFDVEISNMYLGRLTIYNYEADLNEEEKIAVEQATTILKLEM